MERVANLVSEVVGDDCPAAAAASTTGPFPADAAASVFIRLPHPLASINLIVSGNGSNHVSRLSPTTLIKRSLVVAFGQYWTTKEKLQAQQEKKQSKKYVRLVLTGQNVTYGAVVENIHEVTVTGTGV